MYGASGKELGAQQIGTELDEGFAITVVDSRRGAFLAASSWAGTGFNWHSFRG